MAENITPMSSSTIGTTTGTAGVNSQVPGQSSTVSGLAGASGGIAGGNLVEPDIDEQLFQFQSEDTPLMTLMGMAKKVEVESPEVEHYMLDEQRSTLTVHAAVNSVSKASAFTLQLEDGDNQIPREYHTMLVRGVDGWNEAGTARTPGKDLMLFVTGRSDNDYPICRVVNGPASSQGNSSNPIIPAGTKIKLLGNALYETQLEVDPDLILPQSRTQYLQKRGMNQIVSKYFENQKKRIPFGQALIAEQAILNFKRGGNRTLWAGQKGKLTIAVPKMGNMDIYYTEGIRWQFLREFMSTGRWTFDKLIALAKYYFTGEDVPKSAILLAGKNLLESIQKIDYTNHPEVTMIATTNEIGWSITRVHTVFGDIDIKREPTLDTLGWSNSGALIGEDRLVHYIYSTQHEVNEDIEGQEATRKGIVVWDALCLKGACHVWINGDGQVSDMNDVENVRVWDSTTAPALSNSTAVDGVVYYFTVACTDSNSGLNATAGSMWKAVVTTADSSSTLSWEEYTGLDMNADA